MVFNSIEFFIFFPTVVLLYFLIPQKYRWFLLLTASCVFYMAFIPAYIFVLAILIVIDYFAALLIEKSADKKRRIFLVISILSTSLALLIFKYFNFFSINIAQAASFIGWNYSTELLNLVLPIGLSFHTFQSLSYVIEVYRGTQKAERHFGIYALYVMFFPQLVAGPIERPQNLLHQFREKHIFEYQKVVDGLKLMALGLFKKIVIADRLAVFVNQIYGSPSEFSGFYLMAGTVFFAFQIYFDFSGYSDMAIGAAQVIGFKLMDNFNHPYISRSIPEFWQKWHISLSTWMRDYIYFPLGGSRVGRLRRYLNLFIVFIFSGLWHGANWTFVIWGALHGFYYVFGLLTADLRKKINEFARLNTIPRIQNYLRIFITFCLASFGWIFFRADSMGDAMYIISHLFSDIPHDLASAVVFFGNFNIIQSVVFGRPAYEFLALLISAGFLLLIYFLQKGKSDRMLLSGKPAWLRWGFYYCLVLGIIFLSVLEEIKFIYFQF